MPKVSVCATCYNHEKFLPGFVDSVMAQTMSDWELNVVDDCSTDGSFALLRQYAEKDSRIHVVQNDRNRHMCYGGNRSVRMATTDLITIISCDDLLLEGKLKSDLEFFRANPHIGALYNYPSVMTVDGGCGSELDRPADFSREGLLKNQLFGRNVLSIPGLTMRKKVWDSVGGYNPLLRMTQDHELHIKILRDNDIACADSPTVCYRRHGSSLTAGGNAAHHSIINESVHFLVEQYLVGLRSVEDLMAVVPEYAEYGKPAISTIPYFLARHALARGEEPEVRVAGLMTLYRFLSSPENCADLERDCNFLPKDLMSMAAMPTIAAMKDLSRAQDSVRLMEKSTSYRLGLALTWPLRKVYRVFAHG